MPLVAQSAPQQLFPHILLPPLVLTTALLLSGVDVLPLFRRRPASLRMEDATPSPFCHVVDGCLYDSVPQVTYFLSSRPRSCCSCRPIFLVRFFFTPPGVPVAVHCMSFALSLLLHSAEVLPRLLRGLRCPFRSPIPPRINSILIKVRIPMKNTPPALPTPPFFKPFSTAILVVSFRCVIFLTSSFPCFPPPPFFCGFLSYICWSLGASIFAWSLFGFLILLDTGRFLCVLTRFPFPLWTPPPFFRTRFFAQRAALRNRIGLF